MGRVEAQETRACDADCGATIVLRSGGPSCPTASGWLHLTWDAVNERGKRLELCEGCKAKLRENPIIKAALKNTSPAGKYGPEADCG